MRKQSEKIKPTSCDLFIVSRVHGNGIKSLVIAWAKSCTSREYEHGVHTTSKAIDMPLEHKNPASLLIRQIGREIRDFDRQTHITIHTNDSALARVIDHDRRADTTLLNQWNAVAGKKSIQVRLEPADPLDWSDGTNLAARMAHFRVNALKKPRENRDHTKTHEPR